MRKLLTFLFALITLVGFSQDTTVTVGGINNGSADSLGGNPPAYYVDTTTNQNIYGLKTFDNLVADSINVDSIDITSVLTLNGIDVDSIIGLDQATGNIANSTTSLDTVWSSVFDGNRLYITDAGGADSALIFDDGDTTRFTSDNPIKIGTGSIIIETDGNVITNGITQKGDIILEDGVDLAIGTGSDGLFRLSDANAHGSSSNEDIVLGLSNNNQAFHITDAGAVGTDWNIADDTHPTLYIHSNTTPVTDYLRIGGHDGTSVYIDAVGVIQLNFAINGNDIARVASTGFNLVSGKQYFINGASVLNNNTLGAGILASSLTSVGTLTSLTVDGIIGSTVAVVDVDAATTFAVTRNVIHLTCTGPETIVTITGGVSGQFLTIIHEDSDCTLDDTDGNISNQLDLTGSNVDLVGSEDLVVQLVYIGSYWLQVSKSQN